MHFSKLVALVVVGALSAQGTLAVNYVCDPNLKAYCCSDSDKPRMFIDWDYKHCKLHSPGDSACDPSTTVAWCCGKFFLEDKNEGYLCKPRATIRPSIPTTTATATPSFPPASG